METNLYSAHTGDDVLVTPHLPPEIEYEIFTMACRQDPRTILLLVSKRIAELLVPILYEIFVMSPLVDLKRPCLRSLQRYGCHVKHIFFCTFSHSASPSIEEDELLGSCPNISNLVLYGDVTFPPEMFDLHLDHFSFHAMPHVFEKAMENLKQTDGKKYQQWCSSITHLSWGTVSISTVQLLPSFPNLTHFLFGEFNNPFQDLMDTVLTLCRSLEVLVVLSGGMKSMSELFVLNSSPELDEQGVVFRDERVVLVDCCFAVDWVRGARGEEDLWTVAERIVRARRGRKPISDSS
ncbi:hypothetical protein BDN72DRAFT_956212 [Pluteus cervinus]|uniref:Uncharacterized protein n=1 Tax=Pluteus cervinus TaxID=181527 RepID=A0ACD3B719_9AGAR|nr:hypothetical protein BDN72DRAFT_956212 [Pluteus cervinus]